MQEGSRQAFSDLNQLKLKLQFEGFSSEILYWGYYNGETWWRNYLHLHSFFEVCYVLKGEGVFRIHEQTFAVSKGDLFIARPNERHEIIASQEDPLGIHFWAYSLVPPSQPKNHDLSRLFSAFLESQESIIGAQHETASILDSLTREINQKNIGFSFVIEGLVKQLLIETARASTSNLASSRLPERKHQDTLVETIDRYLKDNYSEPLRLKEIAAQIHLSERHMSRVFKAATGKSIKYYATELKMDIAKQLLLDKALSISEVGYATGYQDVRHFSTVFRQQTGSSPSQYREQGGTRFL